MEFEIELEMLVLPEHIRQDLMCPVCRCVLKDALSCPNGHSFCRSCIMETLTTQRSMRIDECCPVCRTALSENMLNVSAMNQILRNSFVQCNSKTLRPNGDVDESCGYQGPFTTFPQHMLFCPLKKVKCVYCHKDKLRRDLLDHHDVCERMVVECQLCPDQMERRELDNHGRFLCKERRVSCPLLCGMKMKRKYHTGHILICKESRTTCPIPGCGEIVQNVGHHNREEGQQHTLLLLQAMTQSGEPLVFTGSLYPVRYEIVNTTEPTKSPVFRTGSRQLRLVMLPPTRHPDNHLGIYINLVSGGAVVFNTRILVTYGPVVKVLSGKVTLKSGDTKGWPEAMSTAAMVGQPASTTLNIQAILQPFLD